MKHGICSCATHCTLNAHHDKSCCLLAACPCWCHGEIKLFLDDERETPEGWLRVYTVPQTIYWLHSKRVSHLSLDNDLGDNKEEGWRILDWLEEEVYFNKTFPMPEITVHSTNAARVEYMKRAILNIEKIRQQQVGGS